MKQPMAGAVALFALGILLGNALPADPFWASTAALTACVAACRARHHPVGWLVAALVLSGFARVSQSNAILEPDDLRSITANSDQIVTLNGILSETPVTRVQTDSGKRYTNTQAVLEARHLLTANGDSRSVSGSVLVSTPGLLAPDVHRGSRVTLSGVLRPPPGPAAPGLFDYREFLAGRGIHRELRTSGGADWLLDPGSDPNPTWDERFLAWGRSMLARGLPEEDDELRLLWAMTLGWKTALTQDLRDPFLRSGTLHIFAISGLHVALIAQVLLQCLRLFLVPRWIAGLIILPAVWIYIAATGWQPSAIRSGLMTSVVIGSWMLLRPVDVLNSLAVSALLVMAWDPGQLFQAGFQLSFSVVAAIGLLVPAFEQRLHGLGEIDPFLPPDAIPARQRIVLRLWRRATTDLSVSVAAWLGSIPLTAHHFHLVTPAALIANLAVVPLSSFALASNLASLAFGPWCPSLSEIFNHGAWFWMHAMLRASRACAQMPCGAWYVATPPITASLAFYACLVTLARLGGSESKWRRPALATLGLLCLAIPIELRLRGAEQQLTILPMHGGHSVCLEQSGRFTVVDTGDLRGALGLLQPFLQSRGVDRIDDLWLTHGDLRHVGGAWDLAQRHPPQRVLASPLRFRSKAYRTIIEQFRTNPATPFQFVGDGDHVGPWTVLHPANADSVSRADDGSLVLITGKAGSRILLLGDLGRAGQELLMRRHPSLEAEIVVSGIPSVGEPLCDGLLDQLKPEVVILADAGMPSTAKVRPETAARLRRKSRRLWCLSESGTVQLLHKQGIWTGPMDERWTPNQVRRPTTPGPPMEPSNAQ